MYGIAVEYHAGGGPADPSVRAACHILMVRQAGYRRRLALAADGWRRNVDLYLFDAPESARTALVSEAWRSFVVAHPVCRDAAPALLAFESSLGDLVVLLRGRAGPTRGDRACWRDHLARAEPEFVLW